MLKIRCSFHIGSQRKSPHLQKLSRRCPHERSGEVYAIGTYLSVRIMSLLSANIDIALFH
jgi:hypothetical protein